MEETWRRFAGHGAEIYDDVEDVSGRVADYLVAGFAQSEPALVVATPQHWRSFAVALSARGWLQEDVDRHGFLVLADADETLHSFMGVAGPSRIRFEEVVGALLDSIGERHPGRRVRVFGEMVDVLCRSGQPDAAVKLETLWNELAAKRDFALLCAYQLDVFDRGAQVSPLADVCRLHSHVRPSQDPERLGRAVDAALEDVLGHAQAAKVYAVAAPSSERAGVPVSQLALSWITSHMPNLAELVLARARAHYEATV